MVLKTTESSYRQAGIPVTVDEPRLLPLPIPEVRLDAAQQSKDVATPH
jgi:hypothetical protein